ASARKLSLNVNPQLPALALLGSEGILVQTSLELGASRLLHYPRRMDNQTKLTFIKEDPWRIFRIMAEFVDSFETLSQIGSGVTIFGSARVARTDPTYAATVELAKGLAAHKLAVITGGGPGIMEAANKGGAL